MKAKRHTIPIKTKIEARKTVSTNNHVVRNDRTDYSNNYPIKPIWMVAFYNGRLISIDQYGRIVS